MSSDETSEERVARLERELAKARVEELQNELKEARAAAPTTVHLPPDTFLAPAPRRVPFAFKLAECLPWNWRYVWVMFMFLTGGGVALLALAPAAFQPLATALLLFLAYLQVRRARLRLFLLREGEVAQVQGGDEVSRGTYYAGTTYQNVLVPVAHGWKVERDLYSGPKVATQIRYRVGGQEYEYNFAGRAYEDGVILANKDRALCVSEFPYDLDRDAGGNWLGALRPGLCVGMIAALILVVGWVALIVFFPIWAPLIKAM